MTILPPNDTAGLWSHHFAFHKIYSSYFRSLSWFYLLHFNSIAPFRYFIKLNVAPFFSVLLEASFPFFLLVSIPTNNILLLRDEVFVVIRASSLSGFIFYMTADTILAVVFDAYYFDTS